MRVCPSWKPVSRVRWQGRQGRAKPEAMAGKGTGRKVENGGRKPTINDVARLAGVSKKTVSRVINRSPLLNEETRERVEKVIRELGYVPNPQARALALRPQLPDRPDPRQSERADGAQHAAGHPRGAAGHRVRDGGAPGRPQQLDDARRRPPSSSSGSGCSASCILPPISENDALARALRRGRLPLRADGLGPARRCRSIWSPRTTARRCARRPII